MQLISTLKAIIIFLILAGVTLFTSCENGDKFASDTNLKLDFTTDKIVFDTVFTSIGSASKRFMIYNTNNQALKINSIRLKHGDQSGFKLSVDGEKGTTLHDVEILKRDSLFAFVKLAVNPKDSDSPLLIKDTIEFMTNGNKQEIFLEAIGRDVHVWKAKYISSDTTITANRPYFIYDSLVVAPNAKLTIGEGVQLHFRSKSSFIIRGELDAKGSVEKPILLRGDRLDNIENDISYDNVPGQWKGIFFKNESFNNHLKNFYTRNSEYGMIFEPSKTDQLKAELINTKVHNTSQVGVSATNCYINAVNCLFTNSRGSALAIYGGKYNILHCTIANYYAWNSRQRHALSISTATELGDKYPLTHCDIINTIVYGNARDEININYSDVGSFSFAFQNCLLKSEEKGASNFTNIVWNQSPVFANINKGNNYVYNFEITAQSAAINNADTQAAQIVPIDIRGKTRLGDTNPDIGCYEYTD